MYRFVESLRIGVGLVAFACAMALCGLFFYLYAASIARWILVATGFACLALIASGAILAWKDH